MVKKYLMASACDLPAKAGEQSKDDRSDHLGWCELPYGYSQTLHDALD